MQRRYGRKRLNIGRIDAIFHRIIYGVFTAKVRRSCMAVFLFSTVVLPPYIANVTGRRPSY